MSNFEKRVHGYVLVVESKTIHLSVILIMMAQDIMEVSPVVRMTKHPKNRKRIELHAHTTMSQMDAVVSPSALVEQAAKWGHPAMAITDHANVQSFPEAYSAGKKTRHKSFIWNGNKSCR